MDETNIKEQFRPHLPKGFIDTIRQRLAKRGISRSRSYIGEVCNPEKKAYENEIITEALNLAAEQKAIKEMQLKAAQRL